MIRHRQTDSVSADQAENRPQERGFALVMVMIVIAVLMALAAGFALSMKVECRLVGNANNESELEWLGRSGVELARYVLGNSMGQPYASLNQIWAGGPGSGRETNGALAGISLVNNELGSGIFSIKIVDQERKFNINAVDQEVMNRALGIMGVNAADSPVIVDSLLDWRDRDEDPHLSGTESDVYLTYTPPYTCKNGPIDDISELLFIRGITADLYWGPNSTNHQSVVADPRSRRITGTPSAILSMGLVDLFTAVANRQININTASIHTLQLLPGIDENIAGNIIRARSGPDGAEGTEDDTPFQNIGGLNPSMVPGINPQLAGQYSRFASVVSSTFEVTVDAQVGQTRRQFLALLKRVSPQDIQVLSFSWK